MKLFKIVSIVLTVSMLSTSLVANAGFSNVSGFAVDAVDAYETDGVLDGYTLMGKADAKRANVVAWMAKSLGYEPVTGGMPTYSDVPSSHPSFGYIEAATAMGLVQGDTDDDGNLEYTFRPNSTITRAEVVKMLVVEYQLFAADISIPSFTDVKKGKWYYEYVETAFASGVVEGFKTASGAQTGKFGPKDPVSNQEAILMMFRAKHLIDDLTGTDVIETIDTAPKESIKEPVEEPVEEPAEVVSVAGWTTLNSPDFLPSVKSLTYPDTAELEKGGLYGEGTYTVSLAENNDVNVHEIFMLEDTDDGLSAFQTAEAIYDANKAELEKVTSNGYCTVGNPTYNKILGDTEFMTLSYITVCSVGLDTKPWGEFTYAFAEVGANHLMLVQFFNAHDVQLPGGAGVDDTLTSDWDFISDYLMKIEIR